MCAVFPSGKRFKAEIVINGIKRGLGEFDTEIEAAKAYEAYARVNIPTTINMVIRYIVNNTLCLWLFFIRL